MPLRLIDTQVIYLENNLNKLFIGRLKRGLRLEPDSSLLKLALFKLVLCGLVRVLRLLSGLLCEFPRDNETPVCRKFTLLITL